MARYYYLGPHIEKEEEGVGLIRTFPTETIGSIDLSGYSNDCVFITTAEQIVYPGYVYLGDDLNTITSSQQKTDWETKSNLSIPIGSYTLLDLLWNTLTIWSDPTRINRAKPITPTSKGMLDLHLGGHSLIKSRKFEGINDPIFSVIKDVFQDNYRKIRNHGLAEIEIVNGITLAELQQGFSNNNPAENKYIIAARRLISQRGFTRQEAKDFIIEYIKKQHRKFLADKVSKYKIEWQDLIPQDVPLESPVTPETTIGDDFTDTNGTSLASHTASGTTGGWGWVAISADGLDINTNAALSPNGFTGTYQANSALSSDDMNSGATLVSWGTNQMLGAISRADSGSNRYQYLAYNNATATHRMFITNAGVGSQIGSSINGNIPIGGQRIAIVSDGSSHTGIVNGVTRIGPITDTGVSGITTPGFRLGNTSGLTTAFADDFEASDLYATSSIVPLIMHHQRMLRQ